MTGPLTGPTSRTAINKATTIATKGNWAMLLFMLGSGAVTYKLASDTYKTNEPREAQGVAAERTKKDYALMMFDAGSLSGKGSFWDWTRHFGKSLSMYGPYGLKEDYQEFRDKFHSIWKEVIIPNLIPIGITAASIYGYFGVTAVHKPFKYAGKTIGGVIFSPKYANVLPKVAKGIGKWTVDGCANLLTKAFKYPAVAAGMLFLSAFGLKTWYEVDTGRSQDEYFRHELFVKDGREE